MHDRAVSVSHPSRDEAARRMGQRLPVTKDRDDAISRHRTTVRLASPACAVDDLCPEPILQVTLATVKVSLILGS